MVWNQTGLCYGRIGAPKMGIEGEIREQEREREKEKEKNEKNSLDHDVSRPLP